MRKKSKKRTTTSCFFAEKTVTFPIPVSANYYYYNFPQKRTLTLEGKTPNLPPSKTNFSNASAICQMVEKLQTQKPTVQNPFLRQSQKRTRVETFVPRRQDIFSAPDFESQRLLKKLFGLLFSHPLRRLSQLFSCTVLFFYLRKCKKGRISHIMYTNMNLSS